MRNAGSEWRQVGQPGSWDPTGMSRGAAAVSMMIMVMVAVFGLGNLLGRSLGPAGRPPAEPVPAAEPAGPTPGVAGAASTGSAGPPPGGQTPGPGGVGPAEPASSQDRAPKANGFDPRGALPAVPIGPAPPTSGAAPVPLDGAGPYGSSRTAAAEFIALTFDDGPDPRWTPQVLELLREYDARATFCVVGHLVETYPELVRTIAADGHTLCNHTWDHNFGLGSYSPAAIREDLERTNAAIRSAVPGARISYYRQPGGAWTERVVSVAAELGMVSLHWAVDPQDWREPDHREIAELVGASRAGAIVLLHDGGGERDATVRALRRVLPELAGRSRLEALPDLSDRSGRELAAEARDR